MSFSKTIYCLIAAIIINSFMATISFSFIWGGHKHADNVKKDFIGKKIKIVPQPNKIHAGFGQFSLGEYYYLKSVNRVFFSDEEVTAEIKDIDFDDNKIEVEIASKTLGPGEVIFDLSENQFLSTDSDKFQELINGALSDDNLKNVVVNLETNKFHLLSSNHYQDEKSLSSVDRSMAEEKGFDPCGFCFKHYIYMPNYNFEVQLAQELASRIRLYSPVSIDDENQKEIAAVGKRVLENWPVKLLGYDYFFRLIESTDINAMALPGGQIFVTTSLYNSLEDPLELEAILAHEIAHVERQHALKTFIRLRNEVIARQALAAIGGAMAGAAASGGDNAAAFGGMAVVLVAATMMNNDLIQYSKDQELESDMLTTLYFKKNQLDKNSLKRVFKKLQFSKLGSFSNPDPESYTHPLLIERITAIEKAQFDLLSGKFFCDKKGFENIFIEPILVNKSEENVSFYAYINNSDFVRKKLNKFSSNDCYIKQKVEDKIIYLRYRKSETVYGEFGAIVKFSHEHEAPDIEGFNWGKISITVKEGTEKSSVRFTYDYEFI